MKYSVSLLSLMLLLLACGTKKTTVQIARETASMSVSEQLLVDSILQYGLDNEALYTLLTNIKPMSSLVTYTFPVANTDSVKKVEGNVLTREEHGVYLDRMRTIQQAMSKLDIPDLRFVVVPYLSAMGNKRIIQLSVLRISSLDSLLRVKENFYGQFGLVPGTDPAVVVTAIEGNDKFERWRGYGYLFGYPDYAVDFYNKAAFELEKTGEFVERNFFRIPTYSRVEGNFVYAYPKDHKPTVEIDSAIYNKSIRVLEEYRAIRNNYLNPDSTLQSYRLIQDYYKK
jgi:hypothetical protein